MKNFISKFILSLFGLYFIFPILVTFIYVFSKEWVNSILPTGFTLQWMMTVLTEPRFQTALLHSIILSFTTCFVIFIVMVPSVMVVYFYFPKFDQFLQIFSFLPFAIPGVILATGLLKMYASVPSLMFWVLVGALFIGSFPLMYQAIRNSLLTLNAKQLIEAAEILGAKPKTIFLKILLPNVQVNLRLVGLLVFSGLFGEFVLTNLLIGGSFETIRIYMLQRMNENGHLASAVMIVYFIVLILMAILLNSLGKGIHLFKRVIKQKEKTASLSVEKL